MLRNIYKCQPMFFVLGFLLLFGCQSGRQASEDWRLVWQEEFEGAQIDTTRWSFEVNAQGGGNGELQYYTGRRQNAFLKDGHLVIQAHRENYTGPEGTRAYTSARLRTLDRADWLYGRFEVRAKLPRGKGLWPAIWLLPSKSVYGTWAASGEIDLVESNGQDPRTVYGTIHFGDTWPHNRHRGMTFTLPDSMPDFASAFHVFTLEWEPDAFRWYVNGQHYQTVADWFSRGQAFPAPFDQRFYLILNVAVGGHFPGDPDASSVFPQTMVVDYIRVYQRSHTGRERAEFSR